MLLLLRARMLIMRPEIGKGVGTLRLLMKGAMRIQARLW